MLEYDLLTSAVVFTSAALIDAVGTIDVRRTSEGKAGSAALATAAGLVLGAINLYVFINDPKYLAPEVAGAVVGTYLTVKWDSHRCSVRHPLMTQAAPETLRPT